MKNKSDIPIAENADSVEEQFKVLVEIIRILRIKCPWDMKQTNESIAHLLIEEAYETIDAIHRHDDEEFSKELGDLLLHIIMHSVMAEERGAFNLLEVIKKIQKKLIERHPHVFADVEVEGAEEVMNNWEAIKLKEGKKSILEGVPLSLPSLLRAERMQHKASRIGFDWNNINDVWSKIEEEINELKRELSRGNRKNINEEIGDLLFSIVNAARFENIVAEEALQMTNNKFIKRFQFIEKRAAELNLDLKKLTLEEMDEFWNEAKNLE